MIYEIQKYGVTVEWTNKLSEADSAYKDTGPGGVLMYKIDRATGIKTAIRAK